MKLRLVQEPYQYVCYTTKLYINSTIIYVQHPVLQVPVPFPQRLEVKLGDVTCEYSLVVFTFMFQTRRRDLTSPPQLPLPFLQPTSPRTKSILTMSYFYVLDDEVHPTYKRVPLGPANRNVILNAAPLPGYYGLPKPAAMPAFMAPPGYGIPTPAAMPVPMPVTVSVPASVSDHTVPSWLLLFNLTFILTRYKEISNKRKAVELDPDSDEDHEYDIFSLNCDQVRRKFQSFLAAGEMNVGELHKTLGVSVKSLNCFLGKNGASKGTNTAAYPAAYRFFKKREAEGIKVSKKKVKRTRK